MRIETILIGIILTVASPLLIFGCGTNLQQQGNLPKDAPVNAEIKNRNNSAGDLQNSELPTVMPANTQMNYSENGGMSPYYKSIKISGSQLIIEQATPKNREKQTFTAEISEADKHELYKTFVANKFDLIKNDERGEIVYDAGSSGINIRFDNKFFNKTNGDNSPLSGENIKRWSNVSAAFTMLEAKYKDKMTEKVQNYAIIRYDNNAHDFIFKYVRPINLSDGEIETLEKLVSEAVETYNSAQKDYRKIKDLKEYKFQYIPVISSSKGKQVWVNAFCFEFDLDWKKQIVSVDDGGSCYFNLMINLKNSNVYDLQVNGEA